MQEFGRKARVVDPIRQMGRVKKAVDYLAACDAFTDEKLDNIQIRVRMIQDNPGQPHELVIELDPDSDEEQAVLAILHSACEKKKARALDHLDKAGFEKGPTGIRVKGQATST